MFKQCFIAFIIASSVATCHIQAQQSSDFKSYKTLLWEAWEIFEENPSTTQMGEIERVLDFMGDDANANLSPLGTPLMTAIFTYEVLRYTPTHKHHDKRALFLDLVKMVLQKSLKVNHDLNLAKTFANVANNIPEILQLLIEHGYAIDSIDEEGRTTLMLAAGCGLTESVEFLLKKGAKAYIKDKNGLDVLFYVIIGDPAISNDANKAKLMKLLLTNHAFDLNARIDKDGLTLLMLASALKIGNPQTVKTLIKYGADPAKTDDHGYSALFYAKKALESANTENPPSQQSIQLLSQVVKIIERAIADQKKSTL